jgi:sugar phosphate permease
MIASGFAALACAVLIYAYATSIFVFYIGGILLGYGMGFTTSAMVSVLVKRWCPTNTGTILGVVTAANGLGGALAAQIVTPIIYEDVCYLIRNNEKIICEIELLDNIRNENIIGIIKLYVNDKVVKEIFIYRYY